MEDDQNALIKFTGPNCFRMQIKSPTLRVVLHTPSSQPETYLRLLQAKETLLDIRKWLAKAWLVEKCSAENLQWLVSLRFFYEEEFLSLEVEALEKAGLVLPTITMRPVCKTDPSYGSPEQIQALEAMLRAELHVPYNGPKIFSSQPPPPIPGRTTSFVGSGAVFAGAIGHHHYARQTIKPFSNFDAVLCGALYTRAPRAPLIKRPVETPPSAVATPPSAVATPGDPGSPQVKWSPRVSLVAKKSSDCPQLVDPGILQHKWGPRRNRPKSASVLLRTLRAASRQLDEFMSFRPGNSPGPASSSSPRGIADELYSEHDQLLPRRPVSAKFHSARQIRQLNANALDLAQRMETALYEQIVHTPGKTLEQRRTTVKSILETPHIIGMLKDCLHVRSLYAILTVAFVFITRPQVVY